MSTNQVYEKEGKGYEQNVKQKMSHFIVPPSKQPGMEPPGSGVVP